MKRFHYFGITTVLFSALVLPSIVVGGIRDKSSMNSNIHSNLSESDAAASMTADTEAQDQMKTNADAEGIKTEKDKKPKSRYYHRAEAFVAGADWEFDGFVAGGQDQHQKSMFATNDLLYLNIGSAQGLKEGDRVGIYRRGERIRDPQTGKQIGFEVRKVATSEVTDRVDENTCSIRVVKSFESVELGDLVKRED
jgi:hypothetical protein